MQAQGALRQFTAFRAWHGGSTLRARMASDSSARRWTCGALVAAVALLPSLARAAACCTSATSFGVGRLLAWEDFAVGVRLGHARSLGEWDEHRSLRFDGSDFSDGLSTAEPWAIVRLAERVQLQGRVPVVLNDREVPGTSQLAGGPGDAAAGARFEAISIGEYDRLPSLGVTLGALFPTGRRPEQVQGPLGAGTTGRGAWGGWLALESEYALLPWYLRLDAGLSLFAPFERSDTHATQWYGPLAQVAVSGGREVLPDLLVLALSAQLEWEGAYRLDGAVQPGSSAFVPSLGLSLSWRVEPHWTLVAALSSSVWPSGLAQNRDARVGLTLGARYGYF